jgi:hypothetical protein
MLTDGSTIVGRITDETQTEYVISQNPFAPQVTRQILKANVKSRHTSAMSIMYVGLINPMNEDEVKDLLAFLMAGGNPSHSIYTGSK